MTQKEFLESYTRQQACVQKILISMKNNDAEQVAKYTPVLLLEIFKNHNLTDAKSAALVDSVVKDYLMTESKAAQVPSLALEDEEE